MALPLEEYAYIGDMQTGALLVIVLGAAEAVVGLALALAFFRPRPDADVDTPGEVGG